MPRKAAKTKEGERPPADAAQEEPAPAPAAAALTEAEVGELPRAIVRRLVKEKLAHVAGGDGAEVIVNKDAMAAFAESARIFIHYLSATSVPPDSLHAMLWVCYCYCYSVPLFGLGARDLGEQATNY